MWQLNSQWDLISTLIFKVFHLYLGGNLRWSLHLKIIHILWFDDTRCRNIVCVCDWKMFNLLNRRNVRKGYNSREERKEVKMEGRNFKIFKKRSHTLNRYLYCIIYKCYLEQVFCRGWKLGLIFICSIQNSWIFNIIEYCWISVHTNLE